MLWNMWKTRNGYLFFYDSMQFIMIKWLIIISVLPTEGQHELFKAEIDKKFQMTKYQSFFDLEGENRVQRNFNEVTYFVDVQYDFDERFVRLCLEYEWVTVLAVFACTMCLYEVYQVVRMVFYSSFSKTDWLKPG